MGMSDVLYSIRRLFQTKKEVLTPLDPERIRRDKVLRNQAQEIQSLKAQMSHLLADKREERENRVEENRDEKLRQKLQKEQEEIQKNKFGSSSSLRKILSNNKVLQEIEVCDKDDHEVFGKFGDLLVLESGRIALTDVNGNVLSYGKNINQVIYKPGTLLNQIKRGRILIPYDKDYNPAIDWEDVEVEEIQYDDEKEVYRLTMEAKKTAKELLIEKDKEYRDLRNEFERLEKTYMGLKKDYDGQKRAFTITKGQADTYNSELSLVMKQFMQYQQSYGDIQRKLSDLTETKAMFQDIISRQEGVIKNLLDQLEESGDKTSFRKAYAMVKEVIDYSKTRLPQQIIVKELAESPNPQNPQIQEGE